MLRLDGRSAETTHRCRVSGGSNLISVLDLGEQHLTGVFPSEHDTAISRGRLELVWCADCGLLQLAQSFNPAEMYGDNYGYRSGLNQSMVRHLTQKTAALARVSGLRPGDLVLDIGSNDGTLLKAYSVPGLHRVGIDPTATKYMAYYPDDIRVCPTFFSQDSFERVADGRKAKIVTSIAMFYDIDDPVSFARQVHSVLADDGIWHLEQSYMPSMLRMNSYDTVCHEHLEYYSLGVLRRIIEAAGMRIVDVVMNGVNGGSFAVTAAKAQSPIRPNSAVINWLLEQEARMGLSTPRPYRDFEERVFRHRSDLQSLIRVLKGAGKKVFGYGASTKGNVLLQFCGLTPEEIPCIADVNPEKFGCFTPGTGIPIVSEEQARAERPDYLLVLPWHFKSGILERERTFLEGGGRMIFPFPEIEIV